MFYRLSMHLVGGGGNALVFILWFFYLFYRTHVHPVLGRIIAVFHPLGGNALSWSRF
jgi:hypothetical protein